MIVCRACGHHNGPDDTFCGSCGAFLEWEGEEEKADPARVLGPPPPPPPGETAVPPEIFQPLPALPKRSQPEAVQPARVKPRTVPKRQPTVARTIRPGDLVCGECGEGNDPERKFCRRCGHSLAEAIPDPRRRWWQRFIPKRRTYAAGERRGRRGGLRGVAANGRQATDKAKRGLGKVVRGVAVVAMLAAAAGLTFNPDLRGWVSDRVADVTGAVTPTYEPVRPVDVVATSSAPGHPPIHAVDLTDNRWWASAGGDDGIGERLTVTFGEPADIAVVGVLPGAADPAEYAAQPRPRQLRLVFDNGATATLDIEDEHEFQTFDVDDADGTSSVVVEVLGVYRGLSGSAMAITSLEFQIRT